MKFMVISALLLSSLTASANNQEAHLKLARACYGEVAVQISIDLSQAAHNAEPGSKAEAKAQARLKKFTEHAEIFPLMETGCHESAPNGKETACKIDGYEMEIIRLAKAYDAKSVILSIPACKIILK